jgi:hypothetical protein
VRAPRGVAYLSYSSLKLFYADATSSREKERQRFFIEGGRDSTCPSACATTSR